MNFDSESSTGSVPATQTGVLYVVATPIGNLEDMTYRAITVLKSVDWIAAEDTRHSSKLLAHFAISKPLRALHDHNEKSVALNMAQQIAAGESVALISDAGTPLVSDPGYGLVSACIEQGVKVVPIPGACAMIAALSGAGLPTDEFAFEGFLPAKSKARVDKLQLLLNQPITHIVYESPHRITASLRDFEEVFGGNHPIVLARELTKTFETFLRGPVGEVLSQVESDPNQQKGEMVLLFRGNEPQQNDEGFDSDDHKLFALLAAELPPKKAAALASEYTRHNKKAIYQWMVEQKKN